MNCTYCDQELLSDKDIYGEVLICNGGMELTHHYEKVNDGELIKFFIDSESKLWKFIAKYCFYNGRKPNFTSSYVEYEDFSKFKNKTIEEIAFIYNKGKIFE